MAQRAGDLTTRNGQVHAYLPMLAKPQDGYWPAGELKEGDSTTGKWQELTPTLSQSCAVFPNNGPQVQAADGGYGPSRARLFMRQPDLGSSASTSETLKDLNWIGSHFFLNTSGYYNTDYSKTPRTSWPYNASRDAGLPEVSGGGGYPTCKQWWSDGGIGLKDRLQAQVDPDLMTKFLGWAKWLSSDEVNEAVIRQLVSPSSQIQGDVYSDYGGQIGGTVWNGMARTGGTFGIALGSLAYFPAMDMVRQALPMIMAFLKMAMVICIPMVLVVGAYPVQT
ncbi:TraG-like protein, N-terminal region [Pseudomonas sp. LAMO17WK12:I10]|nr:TraU protein [Pseudomonas sp. LAMO17WK12:I9]SNY23324.1 TraG-like protein, N-terminal region [Pseudomonas sp. LAMO17WK12:I10]